MLCVLSFHNGDKAQAVRLAEWIAELGGVARHSCMLTVHKGVDQSGVLEPLQAAFSKVYVLEMNDRDPASWPAGPNLAWRRTAVQIENTTREPWLWLEPDAIPLVPEWLDRLEAEYAKSGKPFMGALVRFQDVPPHMSGIAIYPGNAPTLAPLLVTCDTVAFDVASRSQVLPQMRETSLIQHEWRPAPFVAIEDLKRVSPEAVIYHQDKRVGLPELLRWKKEGRAVLDRLAESEELNNNAGYLYSEGEIVKWEQTRDATEEEQIQQHVGALKSLVAISPENARMVAMYLAAAALGNPPPKKKPGRPPKVR